MQTVKPELTHSLLAHCADAHGRAHVTESALIRSRLRGASIKFFAKMDYCSFIVLGRAMPRV